MKNRSINFLLALTILIVGITIGFSWGRNTGHQPVSLSIVQKAPPSNGAPETAPFTLDVTQPDLNPTDPPQETVPPITGPVNVNTADLNTLMTLPGIGEVLAQRIIDYRQAHGKFQHLEELTNVSGIGQKRLDAILDYATVGG